MLRLVRGRASVVHLLTLMAALAFLSLIVGSPWLAANGHPLAGAFVHQMFSPFCHQIIDRSFQIGGFPFAVCARCTGAYAGFALGIMLYSFFRDVGEVRMPHRLWLLIALTPMALDGLGNLLGVFSSPMALRALTGAVAGAATACFILPGLISITASPAVSSQFQVEDDFR